MSLSSGNPGVLIVDDEQNILDALADILEDDFQVFATSNPQEGLAILDRQKVGVVLSDQRMPGMPGHQFLKEVSGRSLATRVLLTGYTDMDALVKAINRSQIFAFVAKPWEPNQLKSLVVTAMEHYRLVEELHSEKFLMENMMNTVKEPIIFIGSSGLVVRANQSALRLLGLESHEQALSTPAASLVSANPTLAPILSRASQEERVIAQVVTPAGSRRWYSITQVAFGSNGGFISVAHDVTELQEAELALTNQANRLEHSLRELQQFTHVTAHHLQEPLRDVVSHLQILKSRSAFNSQEQESFDFAIQGAMRMKSLFSDFVRYINFDANRMRLERVELRKILDKVVSEFRKSAGPNDHKIEIEGTFPTLVGDSTHLTCLFRELLENSEKYRGTQPLDFSVRGETNNEGSTVYVSDRGIGIDDDHKERIFELFQRLHRADEFKGTGLGLAICRKVVSTHGGKISARKNEKEPGITITITFPPSTNAETEAEVTREVI